MSLKIESTSSAESATIIRNFLKSQYSGVLATADEAGIPHAAVVYFLLEDDLCLVFGTKTETQKYKNIQENDQVSFVVYDETEQTVVQIFGRAETVDDTEMRQKAVHNMFVASARRSRREIPPADKLIAGEYAAVKVVPMVIKMTIYARPDSEEEGDLQETLLFSESE
jgi:nitroimidazol reductase NimA-like FMN-containing flavoprotein (pyridoxamine 5'-phosphate oxidase superfamily)